jgi:tight adherence protein B
MNAVFALIGAGLGGAVLLIMAGLRARPRPEQGPPPQRQRVGTSALRTAGVLAAAALAGTVTGWPVAAVLAGVAAWTLPTVLGPDRAHRRTLARVEAIAAWAEDLAGTLRAGAGVEQAIWQTATVAAHEIRPELDSLVEALKLGVRLPDALRAFAADLADPTADMVINVLLQAARHQARDIAASLSGVGRAARRQASARIRVATGRARTRTSTRIVITVVVASVVLLVAFATDFLHPYSNPLGQLILAVLGAMFGGCLVWMVRTSQVPDLPRILTGPAAGGTP